MRARPLLALVLACGPRAARGQADRHLASARTRSRSPSTAPPRAAGEPQLARRLRPDQRDAARLACPPATANCASRASPAASSRRARSSTGLATWSRRIATPSCSRPGPCSTLRSASASTFAAPRWQPALSANRMRSSAASGDGVVLQTADGIEALRCTGLNETAASAKRFRRPCPPSRRCPSACARPAPVDGDVTLPISANGFDWQAHYVATLSLRPGTAWPCSPG